MSTTNDLFDMSAVIGMISALHEMDEDEQSVMSHGTMIQQSTRLLKGLEQVQIQLESVSDLDTKSMIETKFYGLRRVIDILNELVRLNQEDIQEREHTLFELFYEVKRDAKAILETLKILDSKGRAKDGAKAEGRNNPLRSSFDIGFGLQDVLEMIEALGRPDEEDMESVMAPKDIKSRSIQVLTGLSNVLRKLETFLETGSYDASVTELRDVIRTVEGHVATLHRIVRVLMAIRDSPLDEVELAIFQEYSSYADLQQDARQVMESIHAIQFGADPQTLPRRAESKTNDDDDNNDFGRKRSYDGKDYSRDEMDAKSGIGVGVELDVGSAFNANDIAALTGEFGFDFGAVMGMLHELGAEEDDVRPLSPTEVREQGSTMAKGIHQVIEQITPSLRRRGLGVDSIESLHSEHSRSVATYSEKVIEEALFDLKQVLDIVEQLINCDDDELVMNRSGSFTNIKDQVKQVLQHVSSLGSLGHGSTAALPKMQQDERQHKSLKEVGKKGEGVVGKEDKNGYLMPSEWADFK